MFFEDRAIVPLQRVQRVESEILGELFVYALCLNYV
jgi:membrane protein YdbS with pleckstrin-like domain